jgi:DNA-binding NarL/FixJ family response regulator
MGVTVLIVDDHPTFRRFARRLLEQAGFSVVGEAEDCATGIEAARTLDPDAILLDVMLPDGSGLELATALAESIDSSPSVVLMSTRSAADHGAALTDTPARGFIAKSDFTGEAFATLVEVSQ